jgi:hypothetical protein
MKSFWNVVPLVGAALAAVITLPAAIVPATAQEAASATSEAETLLVLQGSVASVTSDGDGMTITAPPVALLVTERPHRVVQPVVLQTYATQMWSADGPFQQIPANAVLVDETGAEIAIIVIYSLSYDGTTIAMTFGVLTGTAPPVGALIALTIDAFPCPVNGCR